MVKEEVLRYLSIASWNIQGINYKTHSTPDQKIHVDGYCTYQVNRPKSGKSYHGGIAILVRDYLRKGITYSKSSSQDIVWVKLENNFFKFEHDIYLAVVYMHPHRNHHTLCAKTPMCLSYWKRILLNMHNMER